MKSADSSETLINIYQTTRRQKAVFTLTTFSASNLAYWEQAAYFALTDSKYKKRGELRRFVTNNLLRYY